MADIEQVRSEVNTACSIYREDQSKMEQAANEMSMYKEQAKQAECEMHSIQSESSSIESEISSLQSQISQNSHDNSSGSSYALQRINLLYQKQQALAMNVEQIRAVYVQAQTNYSKAQNLYMQAESDLDNVRNYLELVRTQMENAADVFQTKILGFNQSLQILGGSSVNMFASAANTQVSKLQISRNQYQENLNIAQAVIEQISGTIDDQGTARVLDLGRRI